MRYKRYECFARDLFPRQKWMSCQGHKQTPLGPSKIFLCMHTHTHTHTPCPQALQEAKCLWMGKTPQMSSNRAHSWSDTSGWASQIAAMLSGWVSSDSGPPALTGYETEPTASPASLSRALLSVFPSKPHSALPHPPRPTLDETDYKVVPEAEVIFHSANSHAQQTQEGHRTSEVGKTQPLCFSFSIQKWD